MKRAAVILILPLIAAMSCGPYLRTNDIQTISLGSHSGANLLGSSENVDALAQELESFLKTQGFAVSHTSTSFGVQPWTGHTQDIFMRLPDNDRVLVFASISKCCITTKFSELETAIGSGAFAATAEQRERINQLRPLVEAFIQEKLHEQAGSNQSFNPTSTPPLRSGVAAG
ncbi:hypothetical protein [Nevskia ramosa]|uniref:hypothetical protein n=1 Tax=Nevskia ramosa TaxID=64002 RepID=UPI003D09DB30